MGLLFGRGMGVGTKFVQMVTLRRPKLPPCSYTVKHFKILFSTIKNDFRPNLGIQHQGHKVCKCFSNDDPRLAFYGMVKLN